MTQFALVENNIVVAVSAAEPEFASAQGWIACGDAVACGWEWSRGTFHPLIVTMRQARLALLGAGLRGAVDAAIATLPSPAKEAAQDEWEFAAEVNRNSPLILQLGPALGLTDEAIDALFIAGSGI